MALERETLGKPSEERRAELLVRLDEIEASVITSKVPGSHADQLYILRQHIGADAVVGLASCGDAPMPSSQLMHRCLCCLAVTYTEA
jgi:hypothetical protein